MQKPIQEVSHKTTVEEPIPEPKKLSISRLIWLKTGGILVILLSLLGATYLLGYNNANRSNSVVKTPTPTPKPTDWLTYHGLDYSFDYPKDWTIEDQPNNCENLPCNASLLQNPEKTFSIVFSTGHRPFAFEGDAKFEHTKRVFKIDGTSYTADETFYNVVSNQNESIIRLEVPIIYKNGKTYYMVAETRQGAKAINDYRRAIKSNIITDIFSSVQFTNDQTASPTPNPTTWKTYTNKELGYSIQYPNSLVENCESAYVCSFHPNSDENSNNNNFFRVLNLTKDPDFETDSMQKILSEMKMKVGEKKAFEGATFERLPDQSVANINAIVITNPHQEGITRKAYLFYKNNDLYLIDGFYGTTNLTEKDFDQIALTFKFTK